MLHPAPQTLNNFNNDPTTLLIRLLDNDPDLPTTTTERPFTKINYKKFNYKRRILEKSYSYIYDTLKATEARIKLNLPPAYIKFSLITPTRLKRLSNEIKNLCFDFFKTNNQQYHKILTTKLEVIKTNLFKINSTRDPLAHKKHLNTTEWKQISKLKHNKSPNLSFSKMFSDWFEKMQTNIMIYQENTLGFPANIVGNPG